MLQIDYVVLGMILREIKLVHIFKLRDVFILPPNRLKRYVRDLKGFRFAKWIQNWIQKMLYDVDLTNSDR